MTRGSLSSDSAAEPSEPRVDHARSPHGRMPPRYSRARYHGLHWTLAGKKFGQLGSKFALVKRLGEQQLQDARSEPIAFQQMEVIPHQDIGIEKNG